MPRSVRCDQAQAFKAKKFEIFCKDNNIRLIIAPTGDHRGTGMVERLIQTIKKKTSSNKRRYQLVKRNTSKQNICNNRKHKTDTKHKNKNYTIRSTLRQKNKHTNKQYSHTP